MKPASLREGIEGRLVAVSRDLMRATDASLQAAPDDRAERPPALRRLSDDLQRGRVDGLAFDETACASPLRSLTRGDRSACATHVGLIHRARGESLPERFRSEPLMHQGGSDALLSPCEPIVGTTERRVVPSSITDGAAA